MGFHLVPMSSGDLKIQSHTFFQWAVFQTISKVDTWLILDRKSYMRFYLAPFYLSLDNIKRSTLHI